MDGCMCKCVSHSIYVRVELQSARSKRNFWAMCQLCTLNIYRIAIYVIAWFSSTNIHALENCLISGLFCPLILCNIHSSTFPVYFQTTNNLIPRVHSQFTFVLHHLTLFVYMLLCLFSLLVIVVAVAFWLLFSVVQTNWLFALAKDFVEFCSSQISIIIFSGPLLFIWFSVSAFTHSQRLSIHDEALYQKHPSFLFSEFRLKWSKCKSSGYKTV